MIRCIALMIGVYLISVLHSMGIISIRVDQPGSWSWDSGGSSVSLMGGYSWWGSLGGASQISTSVFQYELRDMSGATHHGSGDLVFLVSQRSLKGVTIDFNNTSLSGDFETISLIGDPIPIEPFDDQFDFYLTPLFSQNDALHVTSAVPEPSTYALIFGGIVLLFFTWKRKQFRDEASSD